MRSIRSSRHHACVAIERRHVEPMISPSDLDKTEGELMPPNPSVRNGTVLYFKNDMMIYWVAAEPMPEKTRNEFLPLIMNRWISSTKEKKSFRIRGGVMGLPVLIYGKSGSGKSRSLKFFAEDEVVLFNTERKALPFRKRFRKMGASDDIGKIIATINQNPEKVFVIDDAGYIMTHLFMSQHQGIKKAMHLLRCMTILQMPCMVLSRESRMR